MDEKPVEFAEGDRIRLVGYRDEDVTLEVVAEPVVDGSVTTLTVEECASGA